MITTKKYIKIYSQNNIAHLARLYSIYYYYTKIEQIN